jgi:hypothetical protein
MPKALEFVAKSTRETILSSDQLYALKPTEDALRESTRESSMKCPVLQDRIDDGREIISCPRCKTTYHLECLKVGLQSGLEKCLRPDCEFALAAMLAEVL